ncbi:MAG: FAD:protein FMN transferase [bacterium]|nr:FAD:protein FMN transferase [bacterium]
MRLLFIYLFIPSFACISQVAYSVDTVLMGSSFSFTAVASNNDQAKTAAKAGLNRVIALERMISSWDPNSETSRVNINAGIAPQKVSIELFELVRRSVKISRLTQGVFDITFASIDKIWDFNSNYTKIPDSAEIKASVSKIDYRKIVLNPADTTIFLKEKGMKMGFGAIGKGFAAEEAKSIMIENGATSGVVNAGGDLCAWGEKSYQNEWTIGIQDPDNKGNVLMSVPARDCAVVTSGNYEKFVLIDGQEYCHIIHPKTGWPARNMKSVTIICPNAELADGLATSVFILGATEGLALVNQLEGVEAIIIDDENELFFSNNIQSNYAATN